MLGGGCGHLAIVVIALAGQASDLDSIPSDFPVSFPHSTFSLSVMSTSFYLPGYKDAICSKIWAENPLVYYPSLLHTILDTSY